MKTKFYKQLSSFIAIIAVFMVVLPVSVSATDSSFITNVVFSTNSTGGQSSNGADGQAGRDGGNGADGQAGRDGGNGADGQAGRDGQTISSTKSDGTFLIKSTVNGVNVIDIDNSKAFLNEIDTATATHSISSSTFEITEDYLNQNYISVATEEQSFINRTLLSLRLMLINYVNKLF